MSKNVAVEMSDLSPSQVANAIRSMGKKTGKKRRALFIWGPPGISKSAIAQAEATRDNIAFVDVRLSQMDPTDLRGMPFRVEENGVTTGVAWSPPLILPRDLNIQRVISLEAIETEISFASQNPQGVNGIHYVKEPVITVEALDPDHKANIVAQSADRFTVELLDKEGYFVSGKIKYTVTGNAEALVAFEELNSAPPSVLASSYQIILDRRQGEYVVPEGVRMIAMGNRETDKGMTFNLPTPLANRMIHIQMKPSFDDWQTWAVETGIHPAVVGYLTNFKGELFDFNPQSSGKAFATPRSWQFVSDIIEDADDLPTGELNAMITGAVGMGVGTKFAAFRKLTTDLPKPEDVLAGKVKKVGSKDIALHYALTTSLCYELRLRNEALTKAGFDRKSKTKERKEWFQQFDNVLKFWIDNFQPEVCVMGMRVAASVHGLPIDETFMPTFTDFVEKYSSLIEPS